MTKDEKIENVKLELKAAYDILNSYTSNIDALTSELKELESKKWSPPDGPFLVDHTGKVVDITKQNPKIVNSEFGNMRKTKSSAGALASNSKLFNRLSAYLNDINPIVECENNKEYTKISLVFYDWSGNLSNKLREEIYSDVYGSITENLK